MSTTKEPKIPGPHHPITVEPFEGRVTVMSGEKRVADSTNVLKLQEASYPPVYYVPLADVDDAALRPSDTTSYCPYKGDASYYDVIASDGSVADAVWHYRDPYPSVGEIAGHVAFYPDRVEIEVQPAA